jgi:hypothetical protein
VLRIDADYAIESEFAFVKFFEAGSGLKVDIGSSLQLNIKPGADETALRASLPVEGVAAELLPVEADQG